MIVKVARPRDKGRLEDQAERQLEAEFNVLRQASCLSLVIALQYGILLYLMLVPWPTLYAIASRLLSFPES